MARDRSVDPLFLTYCIASLAVMFAIYTFSSQPGFESQAESDRILMPVLETIQFNPSDEELELCSIVLRKTAHFSIYALLGSTLVLAASRYHLIAWASVKMWDPIGRLLGPWIVAVLYAVSDEYHQTFVLERSGEAGDVLIDSAGALLGVLLFGWLFVQVHGDD